MSNVKNNLKSMIILLSMAVPVWAEEESLSGKQLILAMMSSRNRYESIDAKLQCQGDQYSSVDKENATVKYKQTIIYRRFRSYIYCQQINSYYSENLQKPYSYTETIYVAPNETKYYRHDLLNPTKIDGVITQDSNFWINHLSYTPDSILWQGSWETWEKYKEDASKPIWITEGNSVGYAIDVEKNNLSSRKPGIRYVVDPKKNYIPISRDILLPDGTVLVHEECGSFQKVNDLWVPLRFTWFDPSAKFGGEYKILSIKVNEIKSPEELDFSFPLGTMVEDKIRGVRYKIGQVGDSVTGSAASEVADANQIAVKLPLPATEAALEDANLKAQELLAQQKQAASGGMQVVPIEIAPSYVWVLPGKNEYVLSISADGKKPSLVKHTFEPDGLVVQGLENKIASDGKIRVSLERPAEHKSFANGVLMLEFADQKATVHFVAAPLE